MSQTAGGEYIPYRDLYPKPLPVPYPQPFPDPIVYKAPDGVSRWKHAQLRRALANLMNVLVEEMPEMVLARDSKILNAYKAALRELSLDPSDELDTAEMQAAVQMTYNSQSKGGKV